MIRQKQRYTHLAFRIHKSAEDVLEMSVEYCTIFCAVGFRFFSPLFLEKYLFLFNVNAKSYRKSSDESSTLPLKKLIVKQRGILYTQIATVLKPKSLTVANSKGKSRKILLTAEMTSQKTVAALKWFLQEVGLGLHDERWSSPC